MRCESLKKPHDCVMRTRRPLNRGASSLFALILAALLGASMTVSDIFPSPRARTPEVLLDAAASQLAQAAAPVGEKTSDCKEKITQNGKETTVGANVTIDAKSISPETPNKDKTAGLCDVTYKDEKGKLHHITMKADELNKVV